MDYSYYYGITGDFPYFNVAFDGQGEPQQPVSTQFEFWEPPPEPPIIEQELRDGIYEQMVQNIAAVFRMIGNSRLCEAARALAQTTSDLQANAKELGLYEDCPDTLQQHRDLWETFNYCWLSLFQKQIDSGNDNLGTDQIVEMGEIIVEFCDIVEPYGLVDYQMGIWEEEILDIIIQCIDLEEENEAERKKLCSFMKNRGKGVA